MDAYRSYCNGVSQCRGEKEISDDLLKKLLDTLYDACMHCYSFKPSMHAEKRKEGDRYITEIRIVEIPTQHFFDVGTNMYVALCALDLTPQNWTTLSTAG